MKRLISILLTATLLLSALPLPAFNVFAEEQNTTSPNAVESALQGKTLSILGASISTYAGVSNGNASKTTNSTIQNNVKYYPNTTIPEVELNDTWWMQAADDLGLRLLVNNAWSGSSLLHTRNGTVGAYVYRCVLTNFRRTFSPRSHPRG